MDLDILMSQYFFPKQVQAVLVPLLAEDLHLSKAESEFNFLELLDKSLLGLETLPSSMLSIFTSFVTFHLSSFAFSSASTQTSHKSSFTSVVSGRCLCLYFSL